MAHASPSGSDVRMISAVSLAGNASPLQRMHTTKIRLSDSMVKNGSISSKSRAPPSVPPLMSASSTDFCMESRYWLILLCSKRFSDMVWENTRSNCSMYPCSGSGSFTNFCVSFRKGIYVLRMAKSTSNIATALSPISV